MSQTGGLSTSIPRTAFSKSGSAVAVDFGSATVPGRVQEIWVRDLEERTQVEFVGTKEVKAVLTHNMFEIEE